MSAPSLRSIRDAMMKQFHPRPSSQRHLVSWLLTHCQPRPAALLSAALAMISATFTLASPAVGLWPRKTFTAAS